ncbi:MAG TPA: YbaY family lipoprotein [Candidatus Acidoferrales bacterium]|nr:YbaY family lipoprotein [Candidatus Acidoferrales bacterium]
MSLVKCGLAGVLVALCVLAWGERVASDVASSVLTIAGVVTAPPGAQLPRTATVTVTLVEPSLDDDDPGRIVGRTDVRDPLRFPVRFALDLDASKIDRTTAYVLFAAVLTKRSASSDAVFVFSSEEGTRIRPGRDIGPHVVKVFPWSAYERWYDTAHPPD